jgi:hypothetical protein
MCYPYETRFYQVPHKLSIFCANTAHDCDVLEAVGVILQHLWEAYASIHDP